MNRDKQIEEMAKLLQLNYDMPYEFAKGLAEFLIDEDYRKASDVAREIFEEMEKYLVTGSTFYGQAIHSIGVGTFAKLKKKYTGKDTNVTTKESEDSK